MRLGELFFTKTSLSLISADPEKTIQYLTEKGIVLHNVEIAENIKISFCLTSSDYKKMIHLKPVYDEKVIEIRKYGLDVLFYHLLHRPVIIIFFLAILAMSAYLSTHILFFSVRGNQKIPSQFIIDQLIQADILLGIKSKSIDSEVLKNTLLEAVPEMKWVGITIHGAELTVHIQEREIPDFIVPPGYKTGSIVAVKDAVIDSITVTEGTPLCRIGQVVRQGEVLISGYTGDSQSQSPVRAEGEVYGRTLRRIHAAAIQPFHKTMFPPGHNISITLLIGKKIINLYNNSGISGTGCDRMYRDYTLTLPGGYPVPFRFRIERRLDFLLTKDENFAEKTSMWLPEEIRFYLFSAMNAGSILSQKQQFYPESDVVRFEGRYSCSELVGRMKSEEFLPSG